MTFKHQVIQNILFIAFSERIIGIDSNTEYSLFSTIDEQIEQNINQCAVDLSETQYINSTGISILVRILTKFRNKGGEVVLINPSESINKLLIITKLSSIFTIVGSQKEAIGELVKVD